MVQAQMKNFKKIKGIEIINLDKFSDERGYLIKVIKKGYVSDKFGEIYVTLTKPGFVKANHYHKKATEWFCVLEGKCVLLLKDIKTNIQEKIMLEGDKPQLVKIPPFVEHGTKNIGKKDMILFAYADEPYYPSDTIPANLKF